VQRNVALILQKKQVKCNVFIRCFCMDCNILYRRMVRSCTTGCGGDVSLCGGIVEYRRQGTGSWSEDGGLEVEGCGEGLAGACSWSAEG